MTAALMTTATRATTAGGEAGAAGADFERAFREHRRLLWGIAYRMTGCAADADDVVQDAFERASRHPPERTDEPLGPWLVRVTTNVARDALRRRKQQAYVGPWLPSPIEDAAPGPDPGAGAGADGDVAAQPPDARYELRESASFAFLVALEALSPSQRAVLLLRDVLDYSVRETAQATGLSEVNVKVVHHRARRRMASYDATRAGVALEVRTREALEQFLTALLARDPAALEACLSPEARMTSDGGGEYHAALRPVVGASRVARFFLGLERKLGAAQPRYAVRSLNGLPAVVGEYDAPREGWGPRFVMRCDVDAAGIIREVYVVVAPRKLTAIAPVG